MKTCTKCDENKDESCFSVCSRNKNGLRAECKACVAAARAANPEKCAAWKKAYYTANRKKLIADTTAYVAANAAHVAAYKRGYYVKNKEEIQAYHKARHAANPEIALAGKNKRRARMQGVTVERVGRKFIFERDGWICYLCMEPVNREGKPYAPDSPVLEHAVPITQGGGHTKDNVLCAHWLCNARKGTRPWWECTVMLQ